MVAQLLDVEILVDARAEGRDHRADLLVFQNAVETCLLDIEDLASQRKDRLGRTHTRGLGGAACGITLYDEDLALGRILLRAVGKLAGKTLTLERRFAARKIARLARGVAGLLGKDGFLDDDLRDGGILLEIVGELLAHELVHRGSRLAVAEFLLCLTLKLRLGELHADNGRKTFADVLAVERGLVVLDEFVRARVRVDRLRERVAETDQVHTAFRRRDIVDETVAVVVVCIVVLHRNLDVHIADAALAVNDIVVQRGVTLVQVLHVLLDTALIVERLLARGLLTVVCERDLQALREESHLAKTLL